MELNEIRYDSAVPVDSYGPGFFRVAGQVIEGAMIATGSGAARWQGLEDIAALEALRDQVDVILLGMGSQIAYAPADLRTRVEAAGMGLEAMSSDAACRTYNVLLSEGRRVALAVLPV